MSASNISASVPWYKEPTKDQWYAYSAAWLGWTLDAFDFTVFLFIIGPIADEFKVPVTEVTIVFTLTLWMRLIGATAAGWLGDRIGRRWPLMQLSGREVWESAARRGSTGNRLRPPQASSTAS